MTKEQLAAELLKEKTEIYNARKAKLSQKSMDYIYRGWTPQQEQKKAAE